MPPERINIKDVTGHSGEELLEMAHEILDDAADLAADRARDVGAPAGAIVVTFVALDVTEGNSKFGVMPVKSVWMLSGGIEDEDGDEPLSTNSERAWALNVMGNAMARQIEPEDEKGRASYLTELAQSLSRLAEAWGYEVSRVDVPPAPRRDRTRRTTRPSGPGGRSPKQRRR